MQKLWELANLTRFSFIAENLHLDDFEHSHHMADMLVNRCPNLEDLQIMGVRVLPPILRLLMDGHWPLLKRVSFADSHGLLDHLYESFFETNPNLERFCILGARTIPPICLPNLRSLRLDRWTRCHLIPDDCPNLEYLEVGSEDCMPEILIQMHTLRCLVVHIHVSDFDYLQQLAIVIPQVERLALCLEYHLRSSKSANDVSTFIWQETNQRIHLQILPF
jgi:hypothetical protein